MKTFKTFSEESISQESVDKYLQSVDYDTDSELLQELSLMTVSIATFVAKTKQYANKIDQTSNKLKSDANRLEDDDLTKCFNDIAELFHLQRKMIMYSTLTSASALFKIDRNYKTLKQLQKQNSKRR